MNYPIIILVEPSHPGNIGAVARAMKTMKHSELRLVNPKEFPSPIASARASKANDILDNAKCFNNLNDAIKDCNLALALSNRERTLSWPVFSPKQIVEKCESKTCLVFGRESTGLTNDELNVCHGQITIPANLEYQSLNLSHAVQILTYEFFQASNKIKKVNVKNSLIYENMQLKEHCTKTLKKMPFFNMTNPKHTLNRLFCLIHRAQPSKNELNLLHGVLSAIDKLTTERENDK